MIEFDGSPQNHDDAIKDIEAVGNVSERSFGNDLQQHLNGEYARKHNVAGLDDGSELHRLVVVFDAHRQCVDENGEQNSLLKVLVFDDHLDASPHETGDSAKPFPADDDGQEAFICRSGVHQGLNVGRILIQVIAAREIIGRRTAIGGANDFITIGGRLISRERRVK